MSLSTWEVAWSNLVSAQGPLVLGLGLWVWGQGLTILISHRYELKLGEGGILLAEFQFEKMKRIPINR